MLSKYLLNDRLNLGSTQEPPRPLRSGNSVHSPPVPSTISYRCVATVIWGPLWSRQGREEVCGLPEEMDLIGHVHAWHAGSEQDIQEEYLDLYGALVATSVTAILRRP